MRPDVLNTLFKSITELKGVGPRTAPLIEKLAGRFIVDLLWHLPTGIIDRRYAPKVAEAEPGAIATITLQITKHYPSRNKRQPYKIVGMDDTGAMSLIFFHARADYLNKMLPEGETRVVSGKVERFGDGIQMTHPRPHRHYRRNRRPEKGRAGVSVDRRRVAQSVG